MYAKRLPGEADPAAVEYFTSAPQADRSLLRNVLEEQRPESIGERVNAPADTLLDWSYENYIDFLSPGEGSLTQALDCLEVLSLADSCLRADYESRSSMEAIRSSYLIRGTMFGLNQDASAYDGLVKRRTADEKQQQQMKRTFSFRPLRGPTFWATRRAMTANLGQLLELKESRLYRGVRLESDRNLVMDILPAVVGSPIGSLTGRLAKLDGSLRAFASDMAHFTGGYDFESRRKVCLLVCCPLLRFKVCVSSISFLSFFVFCRQGVARVKVVKRWWTVLWSSPVSSSIIAQTCHSRRCRLLLFQEEVHSCPPRARYSSFNTSDHPSFS